MTDEELDAIEERAKTPAPLLTARTRSEIRALVAEVRRLRHNEEKWRAATGAVVGHAQCPPGSVCRETS